MQIESKTANQLATGAPGTISVGETTFLVGQPTDADFVTMRKHFVKVWKARNSAPLKAVAEAVKGLPPAVAAEAIKEAARLQAGNQEPSDDAIKGMIHDAECCAFWVWVLAKKHDAGLKLDVVQSLVTDETVDDVFAQLLVATGLKDANPN